MQLKIAPIPTPTLFNAVVYGICMEKNYVILCISGMR